MNLTKKNPFLLNCLIIFSFILFAIFNVFIVWHFKILNRSTSDTYFHLERLMEIVKSNQLFPRLNLHTLSDNGSAAMTIYPYLWFYPFAYLIKLGARILPTVYFMFVVNALVTMLICYYSSLKMGNRRISYLFSLMYTISSEFLVINFWLADIGMALSATFMPLVIFGFIYWLKNNRWIMLSIGIICIVYSNIPMSFLTIILCFGWLICNYRKIHLKQLWTIIKSVALIMLTTALFWLPALKLYLLNNFNGSGNPNVPAYSANPIQALSATLDSGIYFTVRWPYQLTIYALAGLIVGFITYKHFNSELKQSFIFSIIVLIVSTNFIPWKSRLFSHIGGFFQSTTRMYLIPQVILTYILAYYITYHILNSQKSTFRRLPLIMIGILLLQVSYGLTYRIQARTLFKDQPIMERTLRNVCRVHPWFYVGSKKSINQANQDIGIEDHRKIRFMPTNHKGLYFSTQFNLHNLTLPFLRYNGFKYYVYLDGKRVNFHNNHNQLMVINNIKKGYHNIQITSPLTKTDRIARILTLISLPLDGLIIFIDKRRYKQNNSESKSIP